MTRPPVKNIFVIPAKARIYATQPEALSLSASQSTVSNHLTTALLVAIILLMVTIAASRHSSIHPVVPPWLESISTRLQLSRQARNVRECRTVSHFYKAKRRSPGTRVEAVVFCCGQPARPVESCRKARPGGRKWAGSFFSSPCAGEARRCNRRSEGVSTSSYHSERAKREKNPRAGRRSSLPFAKGRRVASGVVALGAPLRRIFSASFLVVSFWRP